MSQYKTAEFIFSIECQEIPAALQERGIASLLLNINKKLDEYGISNGQTLNTETFATPRRFILIYPALPLFQQDRAIEIRGPKIDAPTHAIEGFVKAHSLKNIDACMTLETPKGTWWVYKDIKKGKATVEVLPTLIEETLNNATQWWPKSMRQGSSDFRWIRPIDNVIAVLDGKRVKGSLTLGTQQPMMIKLTNQCFPHPRLGKPFKVKDKNAYITDLQNNFVIPDLNLRKQQILNGLKKIANAQNIILIDDSKLLSEVAGLVEWPVVMHGHIDDSFIEDIPECVLRTSLRDHQKYFTFKTQDGSLSSVFALVANQPEFNDTNPLILKGNTHVLRARLNDARFFIKRDLEVTLESRLEALSRIRFYEQLGDLKEKSSRNENMCQQMHNVFNVPLDIAKQAGRYAKIDLSSDLIGEFPELQGEVAGIYLHKLNVNEEVANAVRMQYMPKGQKDPLPDNQAGKMLAIADRLDSLAGFWLIQQKPTGSRDPMALRRMATGLVRIIIERHDSFSLDYWIQKAFTNYPDTLITSADLPAQILDLRIFILQRLQPLYEKDNFFNIILSTLLKEHRFDCPVFITELAHELSDFLKTDAGDNLLACYKRTDNILHAELLQDNIPTHANVNPQKLQSKYEQDLWNAIEKLQEELPDFGTTPERASLQKIPILSNLYGPINNFFEHVIVNNPNQDIRQNRLQILIAARALMNRLINFSNID